MNSTIFNFKINDLILYYFLFSFLGWIMEVIYATIKTGKFINRGFLNSSLCPIYGYGGIFFIIMLHKITNPFLVFIFGGLIATALEFIAGYLLEAIFKNKWWDYSDRKFNIKGYVTLSFSIIWGFCCVILIFFIYPFVENFFKYLTPNTKNLLVIILLIIHMIDIIITIIYLSKFNIKLSRITKLPGELLKKNSDFIGNIISKRTLFIKSSFDNRILKAFPTMKSKKNNIAISIFRKIKRKKKDAE